MYFVLYIQPSYLLLNIYCFTKFITYQTTTKLYMYTYLKCFF